LRGAFIGLKRTSWVLRLMGFLRGQPHEVALTCRVSNTEPASIRHTVRAKVAASSANGDIFPNEVS
jgi:hypothetical protein